MRTLPSFTTRLAALAALALPLLGAGCASADPSLDSADADYHGKRITTYDKTLPEVDAIGYDVTLRVDERTPGDEAYSAEVSGLFVATDRISKLSLDFDGNDIEEVRVDDHAATYARDGATLTIDLGAGFSPGKKFSTRIRYTGKLFQADGKDRDDFGGFGGLMVAHKSRADRTVYASLNWPEKGRRWLPLRDHPRDGAMITMRATFPKRLTVVANGELLRKNDESDGTVTWQYQELSPMPPYDFFVAAYDGWTEETLHAKASGVDVHSFAYSKDADEARFMVADAPAAMDFYSKTFGDYRWGNQLSYLEIPMYGGGMENATVVGMDETVFMRGGRAEARHIAFHEMAHHWSGNLVRIGNWNDFWLSEGFTEYLTRRMVEDHDGAAEGKAYWRQTFADALAAERGELHPVRPADPEKSVLGFFDDIVYEKGACVLRMLETRFGREEFTAFLRSWFDGHAFSQVTTSELESAMTAAFGEDMSRFFEQWVYGEYHPEVRVTWRRVDQKTVELKVVQVQTKGPAKGFAMPLELELRSGASASRVTVDLAQRTTTKRVPLAFDPSGIVVDPDETAYVVATCDTGARCRDGYRCTTGAGDLSGVCEPQ